MLKTIAIDDEPVALEIIQNHAAKVGFIKLEATFTNVLEGLSYLQNHPVDLLFLDIQMPDLSGIDLVKTLKDPPIVVFTTAFSEYAVKGFELEALDYLLKPFNLPRFVKACNKAYQHWQWQHSMDDTSGHFFVKSGYDQIRINFKEILILESVGNYVKFILEDRQIVSRLTLKETLELLPANDFVRVHRSFVIAKDHLTKLSGNTLFVKGLPVPLGEKYKKQLKNILS